MKMRFLAGPAVLLLCLLSAPGMALELATATLQESPQQYRFDGTVEAVNRSTIAAQTGGEVVEILVDVDDYVEAGSLILRLRDTEQRARLDQAEAELKAAQVALQGTRKEYQRIRGIFEKRLVSQAAMDNATTALNSARARAAVAEAALQQTSEQLSYTQVRAPYSGIVTQRHIQTGEIAAAGQPLISGISLDRLRVSVAIPQGLVTRVRDSRQAEIALPDDRRIAPEAITIFPYADPKSGTFEVRLALPDSVPDLFPGVHAKVTFTLGRRNELQIPARALVYRSEVTGVYVVAGEEISFRHVRAGHPRAQGMIAILAGLGAGEQVATDPIEAGRQLKSRLESSSHD